MNICRLDWKFLVGSAAIVLALTMAVPSGLIAQQTPANGSESDRQILLDRIAILEKQLSEREKSPVLTASAQPSVEPGAAAPQASAVNGRITDAQGAVVANAE